MKLDTTNFGRRLVIPDIHGCFVTLEALMAKIQLTKNDALFFLGDYIDRGKDSSKVIDYIIDLLEAGFNIFPLMGNHEYELLKNQNEFEPKKLFAFMKRFFSSEDLIDTETGLKKKYKDFIGSLKLYYELEDFYIVHAGFDFSEPNPFTNPETMLYIRNFTIDKNTTLNKKIIHGHQPVYISEIKRKILKREQVIPLDNGCIYSQKHRNYDYTQLANLLCFNLDTFELIMQPNVEKVKYTYPKKS